MDELTISSPYFDISGSTIFKNKETGIVKIVVLKDFEISASKPFLTISSQNIGMNNFDILRQNTSKILIQDYQTVYLRNKGINIDAAIWSITPNPSYDGRFVLASGNIIDRISVTDIHGRDISFAREDGNISIDALPGVYMVTVLSGGKYSTKKVIIVK